MSDQEDLISAEHDTLWRKKVGIKTVKFFLHRVEYSVFFYWLSYQLYGSLIEQYYYKSYGLRLIQDAALNKSAGESFCLSEKLLTNLSDSNETSTLVQLEANNLVAYGHLVRHLVAIVVTTVIMGPLTDRFGRKIGIIFPAIGSLLQGVLTLFIIKYNLNPFYFIIANFLTGLSGDFTSLLSSSYAYSADISTLKYRSFQFGAIESSIAFGSAIGQFAGGLLLESVHCNYIPPILLYLASNIIVILYVLLTLPESISGSGRKKDIKALKQQFSTYIKGFKMYCGGFSPKKTWQIYVATIAANAAALSIIGGVIVSVFFLKTPPFDLSPLKIGIYQAVRSISQGLTNLLIPGIFSVFLKNPDPWIILTAYLCAGIGDLLLGFSNQLWQIYLLAILQGAEGIAWAGSRGLASKLANSEQQSALFSLMASLESLSSTIAGTVWPVIFAATLHHNLRSGTTYFILSSICFLMIPLGGSLLLLKVDEQSSEGVYEYSLSMESVSRSKDIDEEGPIENEELDKTDEAEELIVNQQTEL